MATSVIYVLTPEDGLYKIGRTTNLDKRIKELSTGSPVQYKVVAVYEGGASAEKLIKDTLESNRDRAAGGTEFYRLANDEVAKNTVMKLVSQDKATNEAAKELSEAVKEADAADDWEDAKVLPADADMRKDVAEFRSIKAQQRVLEHKLKSVGSRIKMKLARGRAGKARIASGDEISWCVVKSHPIDTKKLEREYPEIAEKVRTVRASRTFLV
jgi:hypothetical protein